MFEIPVLYRPKKRSHLQPLLSLAKWNEFVCQEEECNLSGFENAL